MAKQQKTWIDGRGQEVPGSYVKAYDKARDRAVRRVLAGALKLRAQMEDFMADIENMVSELIHTYHEVSDEQKKMFSQGQESLGTCPNCGGQVVKGKYGAYCMNKCGMNVSRVMGVSLTDAQVQDMLAGKKILLKGLKSKAGKTYDAYIIPSGTEEYHYIKDGEEKSGVQFKFVMEFPKKKKR